MVSFLALYRGDSVQSAELVAVSTNSDLIADVAHQLLSEPESGRRPDDPALASLQQGKEQALRLVRDEAQERAGDG